MNAPEVMTETVHRTGRAARIGPPHRWRAVLRAEVRKVASVKLWWVMLIPIFLLSLCASLFGALLSFVLPTVTDESPVRMLAGVAGAISYTSIIAAMFGALLASGEFRHRTATHSFLTGRRSQVLGAKVIVAAVVGAVYGLVVAVLGALLGSSLLGGQEWAGFGPLAALTGVGVVVCALWSVFGVAIGTVVRNQIGSVALAVGYLVIGESLISVVLRLGEDSTFTDPSFLARVPSFLPGKAGDTALYDVAVSRIGDTESMQLAMQVLVGVSGQLPSWAGQLVLLAWTAAGIALAVSVGGRRDVT